MAVSTDESRSDFDRIQASLRVAATVKAAPPFVVSKNEGKLPTVPIT